MCTNDYKWTWGVVWETLHGDRLLIQLSLYLWSLLLVTSYCELPLAFIWKSLWYMNPGSWYMNPGSSYMNPGSSYMGIRGIYMYRKYFHLPVCECNHVLWIEVIRLRAFSRYTTIHPTVVVEIGHAFISCMSNNIVIPWPLSSSPPSSPLLPCTCVYSRTQAPPHASSLVPNLSFQHLFLLPFSCTSSLHAACPSHPLFSSSLSSFPPPPPPSLSFSLFLPPPLSPSLSIFLLLPLFGTRADTLFYLMPTILIHSGNYFDVLAAIRVKLASLFLVCTFFERLGYWSMSIEAICC